jgi:4-nitrophenyl phosphatase
VADLTTFKDEIFGSSYSAAIYISRILNLPPGRRTVFVLGESGTETELRAEGIRVLGGTDAAYRRDIDPAVDLPRLARGEGLDESVGAVLLALDFHVNYLKMALAMTYINRGAVLLATNSDPTLPLAGSFFPGAGSVGAGVLRATGATPIVLGKPSQAMMDAVEGKFKLDRRRTCMVGDRLDTDIKFGIDGGLGGTLLVLTGVTSKAQVEGDKADAIKPSAYVNQLGDLLIT